MDVSKRSAELKRISDWVDALKRGERPANLLLPEEEALRPAVEGLNLLKARVQELERRNADATRELKIQIDTSQKRENDLQEREEEARRFLEHNLDAYFFYRHDTNGIFTYVSPSVEQVLGFTPEDFLTHYAEYLSEHPQNEDVVRHTELSIQGVKQPPYRVEVLHRDESLHTLEVIEVPVFSKDGKVKAVEGIARDVTVLENALWALKESQEQFKGIFENAMVGLYRTTPEGHILMANPALIRMLGYDSIDALRKRHLEERGFEPSYPRSQFKEIMERDGRVIGLESAWQRTDGTTLYVRESARALRDESGKIKFYEGTVEDITLRREAVDALREAHEELEVRVLKRTAELSMTNEILEAEVIERKQAEEDMKTAQTQLLRAQRLEAVGNLAGGIAHDFNNLLVAILGYADLAKLKIPEDSPIGEYLQAIDDSASRAGELTKQLLLFSRGQPMDFSPLDLNRLAEEMLRMLGRVIGEDIDVRSDLAPELWVTMGDRVNLEQVIMNLIVNARDAMPEGGVLTVETQNKVLDDAEAGEIPEVVPGRYVSLTVRDTGEGLEPSLFDRIFEPFFTTKKPGKGTGLGLSVAYGIVKKHGGWINVASEPGVGAAFRVFLPATGSTLKRKKTTEIRLDKILGQGERILLVEDQMAVSDFAKTALTEHGYSVVVCRTAEQALERLRRPEDCFDMIFSDVILPGRSGLEMVKELKILKQRIPTLLCSGYTGDKVDPGEIQEQGCGFLRKPYSLTGLLRAVRECLATAGPSTC
ncbi:MAG: hybrid sensor histidine kinase/response regulator [Planctomycetota bacterium]|jgi:PAS domain S-box-containing protein